MDSTLYINKCSAYIDFMISKGQWSGLSKNDVQTWLRNFHDLSDDEMKLIYKLLTNIVYFSENDVIDAVRQGLYECLQYEVLLRNQLDQNFSLSRSAISNLERDCIAQACFIPLLDSYAPYESGNYINRLLVQQGMISSHQSVFPDALPEVVKQYPITKLIIVDDCVGSGDQLTDFWTNSRVMDNGSNMTISEFCSLHQIRAKYLSLFGYEDSIQYLRSNLKGIDICCVRLLNNNLRVFSDSSYVWENYNERDEALKLLAELTQAAGVPLRGYKDFDFAFIMHKTIPDWTLPLFWKENTDWNLLMRRKNSNG